MQYFPVFKNQKNVQAYITMKQIGNLSFKWGDSVRKVVENRKKLFEKIGLDLNKLVMLDQPHGNRVKSFKVKSCKVSRGAFKKDWLKGFDGIVTKQKGVILGIETADCLPVLFVDNKNKVIGAAHAGWRSLVDGVCLNIIKEMLKLKANVSEIKVYIGPHIQKKSFVIQKDVLAKFNGFVEFIEKFKGGYSVNLSGICSKQLTSVGILRKNISISSIDTFKNKNYFSWRGKRLGGFLSLVKMI